MLCSGKKKHLNVFFIKKDLGLLIGLIMCIIRSTSPSKDLFSKLFSAVQIKKTQSAFRSLCSDVAWPQLSECNPGCQEVAPVSAAFVTLLSTVVPQRLFLMLIYSVSILDREWGSLREGTGGSRRQ